MVKLSSNSEEVGRILKALGAPKDATLLELKFEAGHIVTAKCEYFIQSTPELLKELSEYKLVKRDKPTVRMVKIPGSKHYKIISDG